MVSKSKKCSKCNEDRNIKEYYLASSTLIHSDGKLGICKSCLEDIVNFKSPDSVKNVMRSIDRPFLQNEYEGALATKPNSPFGEYMRRLAMRQNREFTWSDSEFLSSTNIDTAVQDISDELDADIARYWGNGYDEWEYNFLEEEKIKLMTSFECPDYGMEMIMKDICFINLDIEKTRQERRENSQKTITNLIKTRSDLMNDANMKPIQSTGAEGNDQITFGVLIKKWENEKPVKKAMDDEMKRYIDTFMVGHLAKMEGLNNEATAKYDQALSEYTINFTDINKDEEEFED